jgi:translocator protein
MSFLDSDDDDPKRAARRPLLLFILATLAVGALGSAVTEPNISVWYDTLRRPGLAPPDGLFPWVWTALYILMAVAAWRVWRVTGLKSSAMMAYQIQLALNLGWCIVFFGLHQIGFGLIEIGVLILAVLATTILFFRADKLAGLMLVPYLAWTGFAAALNYSFWALNG